MRHTFVPLFFRDVDLLQGHGQGKRTVELIDPLKLVFLSICQQREQDAESDNLTVQMLFLDHWIGGHGIENSVRQTAVIVRSVILGQEDRGDACGHDDGQHDLFHRMGAAPFLVIGQRLRAVLEQRVTAHAAGHNAKGGEVLQLFAARGDRRFIVLGIGIADARPHILAGRPEMISVSMNACMTGRTKKWGLRNVPSS